MLSDTALPVVKATLPVVGENIREIAQRFYAHMFEARPDLLDGLFNRGNQADGQQQQALAGSVAAFAGYLVNTPDQLPDHLLSRISHKHVSLGLRPDQSEIVHEHLMWAIVDVLGGAVTEEVAAAWDEVYWLMANMLINKERGMYEAVRLSPETIWRTWRVAQRIQETDDVVTFVVERTDDREVKPSLPGQYVSIKLQMPDGV
nr:globin domain-containing protein [Paenarthrobacter sp. Z7-10]